LYLFLNNDPRAPPPPPQKKCLFLKLVKNTV
jgi:hypothetical protein